jgi:protoporphyrinogen oxidase
MGRQVRRSRIHLRGHWMRDPLDVVELAQKLGMNERLSILWTFTFRPRDLEEINFENFVLKRYGEKLYEYFFRPYTEKLLGIPGKEISISWARQKVRLASPFDHIRENTKTKFQYFYYPVRGGYGAIVDRLYDEIKEDVILGSTVTGLAGWRPCAGRRVPRRITSWNRSGDFHPPPPDFYPHARASSALSVQESGSGVPAGE